MADLHYKLGKLDASGPDVEGSTFPDADDYLGVSQNLLLEVVNEHETEGNLSSASMPYFKKTFKNFQDGIIEQYKITSTEKTSKNAAKLIAAKADRCVVSKLANHKGEKVPLSFLEVKRDVGSGDSIAQCAKRYVDSTLRFQVCEYHSVVVVLSNSSKLEGYFDGTVFPAIFICLDGH